jgi:hypothetical protein
MIGSWELYSPDQIFTQNSIHIENSFRLLTFGLQWIVPTCSRPSILRPKNVLSHFCEDIYSSNAMNRQMWHRANLNVQKMQTTRFQGRTTSLWFALICSFQGTRCFSWVDTAAVVASTAWAASGSQPLHLRFGAFTLDSQCSVRLFGDCPRLVNKVLFAIECPECSPKKLQTSRLFWWLITFDSTIRGTKHHGWCNWDLGESCHKN